MHRPTGVTSRRTRFVGVLAAVLCVAGTLLPLALITATASPAGAATTSVPRCPPDCGAVAAGDPLLVPFMTAEPGRRLAGLSGGQQPVVREFLRKNVEPSGREVGKHECGCGTMGVGEPSVQLADHACVVELVGESPSSESARRRRRHLLLRGRHTDRGRPPYPRDPRLGIGLVRIRAELGNQGRSRRGVRPRQCRGNHRDHSRSSTPLAALASHRLRTSNTGSPSGGRPDFGRWPRCRMDPRVALHPGGARCRDRRLRPAKG